MNWKKELGSNSAMHLTYVRFFSLPLAQKPLWVCHYTKLPAVLGQSPTTSKFRTRNDPFEFYLLVYFVPVRTSFFVFSSSVKARYQDISARQRDRRSGQSQTCYTYYHPIPVGCIPWFCLSRVGFAGFSSLLVVTCVELCVLTQHTHSTFRAEGWEKYICTLRDSNPQGPSALKASWMFPIEIDNRAVIKIGRQHKLIRG